LGSLGVSRAGWVMISTMMMKNSLLDQRNWIRSQELSKRTPRIKPNLKSKGKRWGLCLVAQLWWRRQPGREDLPSAKKQLGSGWEVRKNGLCKKQWALQGTRKAERARGRRAVTIQTLLCQAEQDVLLVSFNK
jgi:hypothetical protein